LEGASAQASGIVSGVTKRYANAWPGVTVTFGAEGDGVKETLALAAISSSHTYTYTLYLSSGLSARSTAQGGIEVVDAGGTVQYAIPPAAMSDSAKPMPAASAAVTLTLGITVPGPA